MSFEEWIADYSDRVDTSTSAWTDDAKDAFESARLGMIPAENAVVIPPVSEWPVWSKGIVAVHSNDSRSECEDWPESDGYVAFIDKPVPAWVPKVGEAVFVVRGTDVDVSVCRFSHVDEHGIWRVVTVKGQEQGFTDSLVKPFHPDHIGKPWGEIPGGVE